MNWSLPLFGDMRWQFSKQDPMRMQLKELEDPTIDCHSSLELFIINMEELYGPIIGNIGQDILDHDGVSPLEPGGMIMKQCNCYTFRYKFL